VELNINLFACVSVGRDAQGAVDRYIMHSIFTDWIEAHKCGGDLGFEYKVIEYEPAKVQV